MERIFHTWDEWECYPAGFYNNRPPKGKTRDDCLQMYADFLRDDDRFRAALERVVVEWVNSCEHYLSNECMNRIAWLGQAAACVDMGIGSGFKAGFNMLTDEEQERANLTALEYLNMWLNDHFQDGTLTLDTAQSRTKAELY